ncbi:ribonuclease-3 [Aerococcus urinaehominis]|nr:ribonuclease III [Aerococcus urinaehominis]SDM36993.1 ribonuclease-3 [Aerococcus urinaehominis]
MAFNFKEVKALFLDQFAISIDQAVLYEEAFTHSSYYNEHRSEFDKYNERIEFLGDAVLELVVSEYLFAHYPQLSEGELSRMRALIVREESLAQFCQDCHFNQYVRLGTGEEASGGRQRPALLCDLFEAVIGALYLDLGKDAIIHFMNQTIYPKIKRGAFDQLVDAKTALQEELQKSGRVQISYQLVGEEGPAHNRRFKVAVQVNGQTIGQGQGRTKKLAEQAAASQALQALQV